LRAQSFQYNKKHSNERRTGIERMLPRVFIGGSFRESWISRTPSTL